MDDENVLFFSGDDTGPIGSVPATTYCLSPATVPTLTDIVSFTVAIALWNHEDISSLVPNVKRSKISFSGYLRDTIVKLIDQLPVPVSIANFIREYTYSIGIALDCWIDYHRSAVFWDKQSNRLLYNLFHHIKWYPNGRIDRVRTARNLLNSPRLTDIEKFRMLCTYCLKDELESRWPALVSNNGVERVDETCYPLIHYWNCYFGNNLDKITRAENQSIDCSMFENANVDNWPAKEYFFDRFSTEEQIRITISFIDQNQANAKYQKMLLKKLDSAQRLQVYMSCASKIILNFTTDRLCNEPEIRKTWLEVRNLVTREDFVAIYRCLFDCPLVSCRLLEYIWSGASDDLKSHFWNHNNHDMIGRALHLWVKKNENDFFFKMLAKSSSNTKRYITSESFFAQSCVDLISLDKFQSLDRLLDFCFVQQAEQSNQFKRDLVKEEFFIRLCQNLVTEDKLELVDKLLNTLLLGDAEEVTKSKMHLSKQEFFDKRCEQLIIDFKFDKFRQLLNSFVVKPEQLQFRQDLLRKSIPIRNYCLNRQIEGKPGCLHINNLLASLLPSSRDVIVEYKKNLLMSSNGIDWWAARIDSKLDLNPFIVNCLPTSELVAEFKERLVFSPIAVNRFRSWVINNAAFAALDSCVNRYLTSIVDKIELKKRIIGNPVDLISAFFRMHEKKEKWLALENWWPRDVSTSTDIVTIKSTLPLNEIFNVMLKDAIYLRYDPAHRLRYCKLRSDLQLRFEALDRFLEWYVSSNSIKIIKYKMQRIDAYKEIDAIMTLLKKRDNTHLKAVLRWFFGNNSQHIAEFKTKKKGEKIVNAMP